MIRTKYKLLIFHLLIIICSYIKISSSISINASKLDKYITSKPNNQIRIEPNANENFDHEDYKDKKIFTSEKIPVKYWKNKKKEALQQRIENEIDYNSDVGVIITSEIFRFYNQLNSYEQQIYDILYSNSVKTYPDLEINIIISGITDVYAFIDELIISAERIFTVLSYENPKLWWIGTYQFIIMSTQMMNQYVVTFLTIPEDSIFYGYSSNDIFNLNNEIDLVRNEVINDIANLNITTPYAILRYLHDYLITNIVYTLDDHKKYIRTLYGALVEHECVCEGYSEAFQYLAHQFNINCIVARSSTHEWNFVELNNKWYIVDVTYDDPIVNGENTPSGSNDNLKLDYFLIGTDDIVTFNTKYSEEPNHILIYSGFSDKEMVSYPNLEESGYSPTDKEIEEIFSMNLFIPSSNTKVLYFNDPHYNSNNDYINNNYNVIIKYIYIFILFN